MHTIRGWSNGKIMQLNFSVDAMTRSHRFTFAASATVQSTFSEQRRKPEALLNGFLARDSGKCRRSSPI